MAEIDQVDVDFTLVVDNPIIVGLSGVAGASPEGGEVPVLVEKKERITRDEAPFSLLLQR